MEYRAGRIGGVRRASAISKCITQVDLGADVLYLIAEGGSASKSYDVSNFGSAVLLRDLERPATSPS